MYWADKVAKEIVESGKHRPYLVDDMFTPSGLAHIGSLRGPFVHDLIFKALKHAGVEATFSYVFNDFDPIDDLPEDLEENFSRYLGFPLKKVPSPKEGFDSFAEYFSQDMKVTLENLGIKPQYLSSYDMYHEGKFDEAIRIALDNAEVIQDIYQEVSGSKKREIGWLPLQVVCENCGKLGTTRVHDWDGKTVAYICERNLVKWAKGCGHISRISPFGGNGKLPWKVDWPAHWMVLGVTIEGEGKDHSSAGGSRDIARQLVKKVFKIPEPYDLPYEFFLIEGKKMASSKGLGLKARDLANLLPSEVNRFLFCRTDYKQAIEFNPVGTMAIPNLFDEYDRCHRAYMDSSDETLSRSFEMAQVGDLPKKEKTYLARFRDIVNYLAQIGGDIKDKFEEIKGDKLTDLEIKILEERIKYGQIWLKKYAPDEFKFVMSESLPEKAKELSEEQKNYLTRAANLVDQAESGDQLQQDLYKLSKGMGISTKASFASLYVAMIGKEHGPKAGAFLLNYPKEKVVQRLKEASGG